MITKNSIIGFGDKAAQCVKFLIDNFKYLFESPADELSERELREGMNNKPVKQRHSIAVTKASTKESVSTEITDSKDVQDKKDTADKSPQPRHKRYNLSSEINRQYARGTCYGAEGRSSHSR